MYRRATAGNRDVRESIGKSLAAVRPLCLQSASCPPGDLLSAGLVYNSGFERRVDPARLLAKSDQQIAKLEIERFIWCLPVSDFWIFLFSRLNAFSFPSL